MLESSGGKPVANSILDEIFEKFFPQLEDDLTKIQEKKVGEVKAPREVQDIVEEILQIVRNDYKKPEPLNTFQLAILFSPGKFLLIQIMAYLY